MSDDILGYLFDALEPAEQEAIEKRMETDPAFREQVEAMRRWSRPLAEDDGIFPPPGLAERTIDAVARETQVHEVNEWAEPPHRMSVVDFAVLATALTLVAILVLPAIATLRGDQARMACAEHLRRLGVALHAYANQESNQLPFVHPTGPYNHAGIYSLALKSKELLLDGRDLVCPSANSAVVLVPDIDEYAKLIDKPDHLERYRRHMGGSYGYVLGYQENGAHHGFHWRGGNMPLIADRPPRGEETITFNNSPNHANMGQNVLFSDGSVRWLTTRMVGNDDIYYNRRREVGAGLGSDDVSIGSSEATPYPRAGL